MCCIWFGVIAYFARMIRPNAMSLKPYLYLFIRTSKVENHSHIRLWLSIVSLDESKYSMHFFIHLM